MDNDLVENILCFVMVVMTALFILYFRYIQADKNIACIFDSSPRSCSILVQEQRRINEK